VEHDIDHISNAVRVMNVLLLQFCLLPTLPENNE